MRFLKKILILFSIVLMGLFYQNCSKGFQPQVGSENQQSQGNVGVQLWLEPALPATITLPSFSSRVVQAGDVSQVAQLVCVLDSTVTLDCSQSDINLINLTNGIHSLDVKAYSAQNILLDHFQQTFQVQLPAAGSISLSLSPQIPATLSTNSFSTTIVVSASGGLTAQSLQCRLDSLTPTDCTNKNVSLQNLANGTHSFQVTGLDSNGKAITPLNSFFTVQQIVKSISLSFSPQIPAILTTSFLNTSIQVTATGGLSLKAATCQLDAQTAFDCTSGNINLISLANGNHTFKVNGTDSDNNSIPQLMAQFQVQLPTGIKSGTINVDPSILYQVMNGLEGVDSALQTDPSYALMIGKAVDNAISVVGMNRIRLEVKSGYENTRDIYNEYLTGKIDYATYRCLRYSTVNDNSSPTVIQSSGYHFSELDERVQKIVIPLQQKMTSLGQKLWINLTYVAFTQQMTAAGCPAGLQYLHTNAQEYAEYVLVVFNYLKTKYGIIPDSYEIMLEPDLAVDWKDGIQVANAMIATANLLKANGYNPKYVAPSTTNIATASTWVDQMATVPGAMNLVSEISYHKYSSYPLTMPQAMAEIAKRAIKYNKQSAMLEWWTQGNNYTALHDDIKISRVSTYELGTILGATTAKVPFSHGDTTNPSAPNVYLSNPAKIILQYFKYLQRGAQRIEALSSSANVDAIGFINPNGKYVVVVKAVAGGSFTVGHLPPGTYGISYSTSSNSQVVLADQTITAGNLITTSIPAAGALTIFQK